MCLSTVTKQYDLPQRKLKYGYKLVVYDISTMRCHGMFFPLGYPDSNGWYTACNNILCTQLKYDHKYLSGFHIFTNKKDAILYQKQYTIQTSLVRVAYYDVTCTGLQIIEHDKMKKSKYLNVVVANKMKYIATL